MIVNLKAALKAAAKDIRKSQLVGAMILPPPPAGHCWKITGWNAESVPTDCNGCEGRNHVMVTPRDRRLLAAALAEKPDGTPFYTDEEMELLAQEGLTQ